MVTQEVELPLLPTALLTRCATNPFAFAFDGGGRASWTCGCAFLGFCPRATLRVAASGEALMRDGAEHRWHGDPFALLDRFCATWGAAPGGTTAAGAGAVVVALSYELRHWVERLPPPRDDHPSLPVLHAAFYDWLLSYSYDEQRYTLASEQCSQAEIQAIAAHLQALAAAPPGPGTVGGRRGHPRSNFRREEYLAAVDAARDYIAAGDVYQVNLAQQFSTAPSLAPAALFAALQREHPVPFGAYVDAGDCVLISNSPECFLTRSHHRVATFPIKGTRGRGCDARGDQQLIAELLADPKERAEHVMIVDLERNDLGRVCCTGSVHVDEFARVHTFPSLHHLVSKVSGRLRPDVSLADILRAMFPGGSITGAPKIRAMEIIDELEPVRRGFYTGAIGFIGLGGRRCVLNLAIRTAVATPRCVTYHAGGGIVADSNPAREYEEALLKAQPFFAAVGAG
ncbi:MAG: aminodeoxychorismate synthase component I [Candidatus Binatia bacterium]